MDEELLAAFSNRDLKVPKSIVRGDLKELAWFWEISAEEAEVSSPLEMHFHLNNLIKAYLRGRGRRMGNIQGYRKHRDTLWVAAKLILGEVVSDPTLYEHLSRSGVTSIEGFLQTQAREAMKGTATDGIMLQAEDILREKTGP